jgi:serine phosphatase RsbU (regulator of sigma subunit)/putative methionine-R-sulfoxide reductase with GAF domain
MVDNKNPQPTPSLSYAALRRLQVITISILGRLELEPLLESILLGAVELLEADHAHLYRYDPELDQLIPWIPHRLPISADLSNHDRGEGAVGTVLETGRTLFVDDYDSWEGRSKKWPFGVTGSVVAAEIRAGQNLLGVVSVNRNPSGPAFSSASADLLELFAGQAAVAITNAHSYEQARRSLEELSRLYEVSLSVTRDLELSQTLEAILEQVTTLLGARSANVRMYEGAKDKLVPLIPFRQSAEISDIELAPGEGVSGQAFVTGEPVLVNDYDNWAGRSNQYPAGSIARTMAAPLRSGEVVKGVIALDRLADQPPFDEHDLRLLTLFANQAAVAITNAQLFEQSQQRERELQHVFDSSIDITGNLDLTTVLEAVIKRTTDLVEASEGEVIVLDSDTGLISGFLNFGLEAIVSPHAVHSVGEPPSGLDGVVIAKQQPIRIDDYDSYPDRLPAIPRGVAGPMVGIPLLHHGQVLGSLSLFRGAGKPPFDEADVRRLSLFANHAAVAIANARQVEELSRLHAQELEQERLELQIRMASAVQTGFLPSRLPQEEAFELAGFWSPAQQVSGDFYDVISLDAGRWGLVIADVSDKGIPAALFMAMARTLFRAQASMAADPAEVLAAVNREIVRVSHSGMFVTAVYAEYQPANRRLRLANAGHNRPLLLRTDADHVTTLHLPGMALGVVADAEYESTSLDFQPGDLLLLYTDGITEAINRSSEQFGIDRLHAELIATRRLPSTEALERLKASVDHFCESLPQFDDLTCLLLRALDDSR